MIIVNGQLESQISVLDRGLNYGDGFFTTALLIDKSITSSEKNSTFSRIFSIEALDEHFQRLRLTAEKLHFPQIDWQTLTQELDLAVNLFTTQLHTKEQDKKHLYVLKMVITRGKGGRGYSVKGCNSVNRIIAINPYPEHYHAWRQNGINLYESSIRIGKQPQLAGLKHLNRLEQVLIRQEMDSENWQDVVVCDYDGSIVEASAANLFWRKGNVIFTPDLSYSGVAGILRARIIKLIETGKTPFRLEIVKAKITTLYDAEELFLTNALMPILPVNKLVLGENRAGSTENHSKKMDYIFAQIKRVAYPFFYENLNLLYLNSAKP